MASWTTRNYKPEIVSPAGNPEKLAIAIKYGADAVYFGGEEFNLRDKAGNFSIDEIEKAINTCRSAGVRSIFLMNSFLHEKDIQAAGDYIDKIRDLKFDAVMVSDPGMLLLLKEHDIKADLHLSTQMSTLNHLSIKFWNSCGIKRIVLARETTLDEIKKIREHTDAEIEIFSHGALCVSYSGRCLLSRFMSGRDANMGDCSHPCRWKFSLVEEKRPGNHLDIIEHVKGTEILSSKDLCLIDVLPEYVKAGVNAFKIEGRMKSVYYTANTARIYSHAVRTIVGKAAYNDMLPFYQSELDLISHRPFTSDLFNEFGNMAFGGVPYIKKAQFLGYILSTGRENNEAYVKIFNPVFLNEETDVIFPITDMIKDGRFKICEIIDDVNGKSADMAQPNKIYRIKFDKAIFNDGILRRRL